MIVTLASCFGLAGFVLIGGAAWAYFSQQRNTKMEPTTGTLIAPIILGVLGIIACFAAVGIVAIFVWGFANFSS